MLADSLRAWGSVSVLSSGGSRSGDALTSMLRREEERSGRVLLVAEGASVREVAKAILKCHPATLYRELGKVAPLTSADDERVSSPSE